MMKQTILILFSITCLNGFSQYLQTNPWRIDKIIGIDMNNTEEFTLQKVDTTDRFWAMGNTIRFFSNGKFECSYSSKCGNNCFPSSIGSYQLSDTTNVTIFLDEYNQAGECEEIHRTIRKTIGTYLIVHNSDATIKLIKQKKQ
jgi:hypothetical protein